MSSRRVIIALKGLGALANHGVYDFERTQEQRFSADVVMWIETAGTTDDIAATVSYADIADETMAVLTGNPVDLIETLAETIASRVMSHEGVVGTEVTVHKPDAPINHPFADVSVTVRRGETDAMPLSLSLKGIYEAEAGSVLTGEIEAYGRAQAPSPAQQKKAAPTRKRRGEHAAPARPEDISRPAHLRARRVVLAIGGNLGDVPVTLMHTVEALSYMEGFQIEDVSPIMRTKPVLAPGQAPQPDYWNAVVVGSAIATPDELFAQTSRIERELGRERHERWGARSIDIDIIQVEGLASSDPVLTLQHPRAKERGPRGRGARLRPARHHPRPRGHHRRRRRLARRPLRRHRRLRPAHRPAQRPGQRRHARAPRDAHRRNQPPRRPQRAHRRAAGGPEHRRRRLRR